MLIASDKMTASKAAQVAAATVYVLIPVFNRWKLTQACLSSLSATRLPESAGLRVVVIDDGSTDDTPQALPREFPGVEVLQGDGELWWTGAMELAVDHLRPRFGANDYVMALNNDSLVAPDTIERLIEVSRARGGAMVAAMAKETDRYLHVGGRFVWRGLSPGRLLWHTDKEVEDLPPVIDAHFLFGHATIMPASVFDKVGNFMARRYPQYFGDTEFTYRAYKAGVPMVVSTDTVVDCCEDEGSTGLHFGHSLQPSLAKLNDFLFSKKSAFNLPGTWRFASQHAPGNFPRIWALKLCTYNTLLGLVPYFNKYSLLGHAKHGFTNLSNLAVRPTPVDARELAKAGFTPDELLDAKVITRSTRWQGCYSLLDDGRAWPEGYRERLEPLLRNSYRLSRRLFWPIIYATKRSQLRE